MKLYRGQVKMHIEGEWHPIDLKCEMALFIGTQLSLDNVPGPGESTIVEIINISPLVGEEGDVFWTRTLSLAERALQVMVQAPWKGCTCSS